MFGNYWLAVGSAEGVVGSVSEQNGRDTNARRNVMYDSFWLDYKNLLIGTRGRLVPVVSCSGK
jgi:hypothetical protein